ncbi:FCS-Like Zinc finger 6-like [Benincasa hispida]|uniref:FCS-Like Zinc finger 6-like n=1 Tax=Benincasa hispida TaxID=102211 RepID=UPI0019007D65|nr:FCS-Like Zinc finger 6-like [Benincasa hispida]
MPNFLLLPHTILSLSLSLRRRRRKKKMMILGKRPRGQMKRTASVSGITVDLSHVEGEEPSDDQNPSTGEIPPPIGSQNLDSTDLMNYTLSFVSPRGRTNLSAFNKDTNHHSSLIFLRSCTFCHRRLSPARDIYMYMGDTAFCSAECREQKMEQDCRKEKGAAATTTVHGGSRHKETSDCGSGV